MNIFGRRSETETPKPTGGSERLKMTTELRSRMYEEGQYAKYGLKKRKPVLRRKENENVKLYGKICNGL